MSAPLRLELALETYPQSILEVGLVDGVPAFGDYVTREDSGWYGYVTRRRFNIRKDGSGIDVRVWLRADPPSYR
jgi:hypothetical protein